MKPYIFQKTSNNENIGKNKVICKVIFTKKEIKEHALKVLDAVLNDGMVRMKEDGIYESVFSNPKRR